MQELLFRSPLEDEAYRKTRSSTLDSRKNIGCLKSQCQVLKSVFTGKLKITGSSGNSSWEYFFQERKTIPKASCIHSRLYLNRWCHWIVMNCTYCEKPILVYEKARLLVCSQGHQTFLHDNWYGYALWISSIFIYLLHWYSFMKIYHCGDPDERVQNCCITGCNEKISSNITVCDWKNNLKSFFFIGWAVFKNGWKHESVSFHITFSIRLESLQNQMYTSPNPLLFYQGGKQIKFSWCCQYSNWFRLFVSNLWNPCSQSENHSLWSLFLLWLYHCLEETDGQEESGRYKNVYELLYL